MCRYECIQTEQNLKGNMMQMNAITYLGSVPCVVSPPMEIWDMTE